MSIAKSIAKAVVLPMRISYKRPLEIILLFLALLVMLALLVLSLPPVVDAVIAKRFLPSLHTFLLENRAWLARWSASLRLTLEILTAVAIGGSVFAAWTARSMQECMHRYETHLLGTVKSQMSALEKQAYRNIRKISYLVATARYSNLLRRIPALMTLCSNAYSLINRTIPMSYARFITIAFPTSFPGGLYGLLAFLFLAMLCAIKVVQIYLPQLPDGCGG